MILLLLSIFACSKEPPEGYLQPCITVADCPDEEMICAQLPFEEGYADARCTFACDPKADGDDCPWSTCALDEDPIVCEQLIGDEPGRVCHEGAALVGTAEEVDACGPVPL